MIALVWLVIIAVGSLLVVRLGTTALTLTGMTRDAADFQAYSAFFGVGFTTRESEQVVAHPVRRRIVQHLILAGQVGLTSVIVPLVVTFVNVHDLSDGAMKLGLIVATLAILWLVTNSRPFRSLVDRSVKFALSRSGPLLPPDHEVLLHLDAGFVVSEIPIGQGHLLAGQILGAAGMHERGLVVLGLTGGDGTFIGAPKPNILLRAGDTLTVYGREQDVAKMQTASPNPCP